MHFHILESGSKGNCTIVSSNDHYLVIDDGISNRKLESKLKELNIQKSSLGAVLVTHAHSDHIAGIKSFDTDIIYATEGCSKEGKLDIKEENYLIPFEEYDLESFHITVLPTSHDALGSIGFIIESNGEKLVYITDTGYIYEKVVDMISNADYYIFESNHNVRMQIESNRPQYLKQRIMGDEGHLSNYDSAQYICDVIGNKTKEIVLAHISEDANTPEQALLDYQNVFEERGFDVEDYRLVCASQHDTVSGGKL